MWRQPLQSLDFTKSVHLKSLSPIVMNMKFEIVEIVASAYLFNVFIVLLHALDGYVFASFNTLCLEHLGERAFSLLAY